MTDIAKFPGAIESKWSSGSPTLAASGAIFLEGDQWGVWEGWLAVATLKDQKLCVFEFDTDGALLSQAVVPVLNGAFSRLRTPMVGPDGALYVTTSNGGSADKILRITVNTPPTGAPTITGITEVGEELTANTSGIADADGLDNVGYAYQWVRVASGGVETDIPGARSSTYTVQVSDVDSHLKVRLSFTDDENNAETLTSDATPAAMVAQVTVSFGQAAYSVAEGGSVIVTVELSADPERSVTIPLTVTNQGRATSADYSGVPPNVAFTSGERSKTFTLSAADDSIDDDGESVLCCASARCPRE